MSGLASVLIHHLRRIAASAGTTFDSDCEAETRAEVDALEQRIVNLETKLDALLFIVRRS
jgi:BMFP domain-containing protein YqiC